jgi:hypothetical protein
MENRMSVDFAKPVLFDAANNGYMVTLAGGLPYEVLASDSLMASVSTWLAQGNIVQPYIPPDPVPIDPDAQLSADIIQDYIDTQKQTKKWQDRKSAIEADRSG